MGDAQPQRDGSPRPATPPTGASRWLSAAKDSEAPSLPPLSSISSPLNSQMSSADSALSSLSPRASQLSTHRPALPRTSSYFADNHLPPLGPALSTGQHGFNATSDSRISGPPIAYMDDRSAPWRRRSVQYASRDSPDGSPAIEQYQDNFSPITPLSARIDHSDERDLPEVYSPPQSSQQGTEYSLAQRAPYILPSFKHFETHEKAGVLARRMRSASQVDRQQSPPAADYSALGIYSDEAWDGITREPAAMMSRRAPTVSMTPPPSHAYPSCAYRQASKWYTYPDTSSGPSGPFYADSGTAIPCTRLSDRSSPPLTYSFTTYPLDSSQLRRGSYCYQLDSPMEIRRRYGSPRPTLMRAHTDTHSTMAKVLLPSVETYQLRRVQTHSVEPTAKVPVEVRRRSEAWPPVDWAPERPLSPEGVDAAAFLANRMRTPSLAQSNGTWDRNVASGSVQQVTKGQLMDEVLNGKAACPN